MGADKIEALEPRTLFSVFVVSTTADSGSGSLRDAIILANASSADAKILFDLGSGLHTIRPLSALPAIVPRIDIEGTADSDGNPLIELDGANAGISVDGLTLVRNTPGNLRPSLISGLIINRFSGTGMHIDGDAPAWVFGCRIGTDFQGKHSHPNGAEGIQIFSANNQIGLPALGHANQNLISGNGDDGISISGDHNTIQNCLIGTDLNGKFALPNGGDGILVGDDSALIGGDRAVQRNIISGNGERGIDVNISNDDVIQGNYIGLSASGSVAIPNLDDGILLDSADGCLVGGDLDDPGARNVIGGIGAGHYGIFLDLGTNTVVKNNFIGTDSTGKKTLRLYARGISASFHSDNNQFLSNVISGGQAGLVLQNSSQDNIVSNCKIGTDVTGKIALGNTGDGVVIADSGQNTFDTNIIANSGGRGIVIVGNTAFNNKLTHNRIFNNGKLGISLGGLGVPLPNHPTSTAGPNDDQNYPVFASLTQTSTVANITGTLPVVLAGNYLLEFYISDPNDSSGFGEGRTFFSQGIVQANAAGNIAFDIEIPALAIGQHLTAIAISPGGDTSEFAKDIGVKGASVTGTVFNDANHNGKADTGELGLKGRTVFADLDSDGVVSETDIQAVTDSSGNYRLFGVPSGTIRVRLKPTSGWTQTFPASFRTVTIASLGLAKGVTFGQTKAAVVPDLSKFIAIKSDDTLTLLLNDSN
jgi:parallel beta-helix repeat protein